MIPADLIRRYKLVYIAVHGLVNVSNLAIKIIDTKTFQRLKDLKQIGTAYFVYPSAVHTRFEHSIGTYYLTDKLLNTLKDTTSKFELKKCLSSIPELKDYYSLKKDDIYLDNWICELIKIAALCHDLGHGPFSHVFDNYLENNKCNSTHEKRSQQLLYNIIKDELTENEIKFIQILIDPPENRKGFVYQIVANKINSIDVDKLDYINRDNYSIGFKHNNTTELFVDDVIVINNELCYCDKTAYEIVNLFILRYKLHKQVCTQKTVLSAQCMIEDIINLLNKELNIIDSIKNLDKFIEITDNYILQAPKFIKSNNENIKKAKYLINRLENRDLYKVEKKKIFKTKNECNEYYNSIKNKYTKDKYFIIINKIGMFPRGIVNPFQKIYFYRRKEPSTKFILGKNDISSILPDQYNEYYIVIFKL